MATPVTDVVWRARQLIHDSAGSRWDDTEMLHWFNDGARELIMLKPSASADRRTISLVAGTVQTIPDDAAQLLRITHNTGGPAIRLIDQDRLDASVPTWRTETPTSEVFHYMYDEEDPREFQVYPPNDGTGAVEARCAMMPRVLTHISQDFPLEEFYIPVMVDYLLYRAYSKHSKFSGNENRAAGAYQRFAEKLGVRNQLEIVKDPNITNKGMPEGIE